MSSHHIVRDNQEPALIIANGEICNLDLIHQLLEWSPHVMALDGALKQIEHLNLKINTVLGDFDYWNIEEIKEKIQPDTEIIHNIDQNKTDLEKGIEYLLEKGFTYINIVGATGKRSDHSFNNISILGRYFEKANLVIYDNHSKVYPLPNIFSKFYKKDTNISLIPLNKVENINSKNLVWELENLTLEFPFNTGNSNKVKEDGIVEINFKNGILLLFECHD